MKKIFSAMLALILLLSCLSGMTLMAGAAESVPTIDTPSSATEEAAVILNPTGKTPDVPKEYTTEMVQKILVETAKAYYYHNPYVQYDGRTVTTAGLSRFGEHGAPEDAAVDSQIYSVCSNYCWKVYENAFNHPLFRMTHARTRTWCDFPEGTPEVVYQYTGPDSVHSKGETNLEKALVESRKVLQPGDVIVGANPDSGHAMLFVGDILGDGTEHILHCAGDSYVTSSGEDKIEKNGSIKLVSVDTYCYGTSGWNLSAANHSSLGFAILRPTLDPAFPKTPTATGIARLQYPGLNTWRELDRMKYETVLNGEEVPVYLKIANKGFETLYEVPVEEYIPAGTTLVEGSLTAGAKVEGNTIKWAVKIPAGKEITLTYKVKISGKMGDVIDFKGGFVGGIHTRNTTLTIGGVELTDAQMATVMDYGKNLVASGTARDFMDLDFFNEFYKGCFGVDIGLPKTANEFMSKIASGLTPALKENMTLEEQALKE